jgi:hypothetical protein
MQSPKDPIKGFAFILYHEGAKSKSTFLRLNAGGSTVDEVMKELEAVPGVAVFATVSVMKNEKNAAIMNFCDSVIDLESPETFGLVSLLEEITAKVAEASE